MEDLAALLGTLPERVDALTLESAHVVLLFARDLVVEAEMAEGAAAQVARVEMADGVLVVLAVGRIMHGMGVVMTVASVDVEACEAG